MMAAKVKEDGEERDAIISLNNIHKTYLLGIEGVPALRGINLKVFRGEFCMIYGTSGGGKSSLLNILGTIDVPTKGEMTICDTVIRPNTKDNVLADLRLNNLGFVFQSFNLLSSFSALENVELPLKLSARHSAETRRQLARKALESVGLGHRLGHFPNMLSGGEQQRVAIARAIANEPDVLLCDEPTGSLDTTSTNTVVALLRHINRVRGTTLLMVTHDPHLRNFADRVVWMRDGKVGRIEVIPSEKRMAAWAELDAAIRDGKGKHGEELCSVPGEKYQPASAEKGLSVGGKWSATEVRRPGNYEMFDFAKRQRQQQVAHVERETVRKLSQSQAGSLPQSTLRASPTINNSTAAANALVTTALPGYETSYKQAILKSAPGNALVALNDTSRRSTHARNYSIASAGGPDFAGRPAMHSRSPSTGAHMPSAKSEWAHPSSFSVDAAPEANPGASALELQTMVQSTSDKRIIASSMLDSPSHH